MSIRSLCLRLREVAARFGADTRGNFVVITAILLLPLLVAAGGTVDFIFAYHDRGTLQDAADAAALGASAAEPQRRSEVARAVFATNLPGQLLDATVDDVVTNDDDSVTVHAHYIARPFFLPLVGMSTVRVEVAATAIARMTEEQTVTTTETKMVARQSEVCMLALAPSGGNALLVNSPADVDANECEIHVRSSSNDAFMFNSNTRFDADRFCIKGTATVRGSTDGEIETGCDPAVDEVGAKLPVPPNTACTYNNYTVDAGNNLVMAPGVYCGWTNINGSPRLRLNPGLYVIRNGGWNLNDGTAVTGNGVTFYLDGNGAAINMNGKMSWNVTAPNSGTYAGILYFQEPTLPAANFIFNGQNGQRLQGLIYLPTQNIQFKSKSFPDMIDSINVIANTIMITGEAEWRMIGNADYKIPGKVKYQQETVTTTTTIPGENEPPRLVR